MRGKWKVLGGILIDGNVCVGVADITRGANMTISEVEEVKGLAGVSNPWPTGRRQPKRGAQHKIVNLLKTL